MSKGKKFDAGKPRWSLLPPYAINEVLAVLEYGATKYSAGNWKEVEHGHVRYYDAAMRHIDAWWCGGKNDEESGRAHLAHAVCCLLFLMWLDEDRGI